MIITDFKRVLRSGFVSFWRNGFISLSAVLVMTVTLFVIGSTIFLSAILQSSLAELKDKVDINVYFVTTATEPDIMAIKSRLEQLPEVRSVEYLSREQTLAEFKERHKDEELTLQALDELGENPLGATLNIKAKDPGQYEGIALFLKSDNALGKDKSDIIDDENYHKNKEAIDRLTKIIGSAQRLGLAVNIALAIVAVLISFNTIRLAIYISREEISVMRLVGAGNTYIRGPFVVAGILYGLVAALLTLVLFYPATYWLADATVNFFSGINVIEYYFANFVQFFGIIVGSGMILGALSSYLAVKRHLRV
jgi:cell division transport system permease protein